MEKTLHKSLIIYVVTLTLATSGFSSNTWTGRNGNARQDGYVPIFVAPEGFSFAWEWTNPIGKSMYPITAGDDKVFVSSSSHLYGIDADTGDTLWDKTGYAFREPAYANGGVFIPTGEHSSSCGVTCSEKTYMRRFDPEYGDLIWSSEFGSQWSKGWGPTPYADMIYYNGGYYGGLYRYMQSTGASTFKSMAQYHEWSPAVDQNNVYCYVAGKFYTIDRITLATLGTISDPAYSWSGYSMNTLPVLGSSGNVFVRYSNRLMNFNTRTNSIAWSISGGFSGLPVYNDGVVYAIRSGELVALDETVGTQLWSWKPEGQEVKGNFVLTNSHIFAGTSSETHAVSLITYDSDWSYPEIGYLAMANNQFYIANSVRGAITALYVTQPGGTLEKLEVWGPNDVRENSPQQFRAIAYYDNGSLRDVTDLAQWWVEPNSTGSIDTGLFHSANLTIGADAVINAEFVEGSIIASAQKNVHVYVLSALDIYGPNEIPESSVTGYQAIAYYDNGTSKDVTGIADWFTEPNNVCRVTQGLITTERIHDVEEDILIYAQYSENDNDVSNLKNAQVYAVCSWGKAIQFDGQDDSVIVPDNDELSPQATANGELTVTAFIRAESLPGPDGQGRVPVVTKGGSSNWEYALYIHNDGSISFDTWQSGGSAHSLARAGLIKTGQWYHLAGVYKKNEFTRLYLDGKLITDSNEFEGSCTNRSSPLYLGRRGDGQYYNGAVDEVTVWREALDEQKIRELLTNGVVQDEPNLVAYWNFEQEQGQTVYDSSINGCDGRLGSSTEPDSSDPIWIESFVPVLKCTLEGLVERDISEVMQRKQRALWELQETVQQERAVFEMLDTHFKDRDFRTASKNDVVKCKQRIHSAVQHEQRAALFLDSSLKSLQDGMKSLGIESQDLAEEFNLDLNGFATDINEPSAICRDIFKGDLNGDCYVDFLDFALFADEWRLRGN